MKRIRIFFEYLAAFVIIFLLLFAIGSAIVVKYYGDEVKKYTMELVNEQVDTKIYVKEIGISLFRKFPYTSLFFNDVTVWSGHGFNRSEFNEISTDTLFTAENIYLQFNIIDLARKKYTIKNLEARNGLIRILSDSNGAGNYNVSAKSSDEPGSFLFDLKSVNIKNYKIQYINKAKSLDANLMIENLQLEGNFSRVNYQLKTITNAHLYSMHSHDVLYLSDQAIQTNISLQVKNNVFSISKGEIELGDLVADITGEFLVSNEGTTDLNLKLAGRKIDIAWLLDILNKNGLSSIEKLSGRGKLDINAEITGLASSTLMPHIQTDFSTQGAYLSIKDFASPLKSLNITGSFSNGLYNSRVSSSLEISSFSTLIENSEVSGALAIQNFVLPRFTLKILGSLELQDLINLSPSLPIRNTSGSIFPDIQINGLITGLGSGKPGISFTPEGSVSFNQLGFFLDNEGIDFTSLNGSVDLSNMFWNYSLSGSAGLSDFSISGNSTNPLDYLLNDKKLNINASYYSSLTDLDDLLKDLHGNRDSENSIQYPKNISLRLGFKFEALKKGPVSTQNTSGVLIYSYPTVRIDSLQIETMGGNVKGKIGLNKLDRETQQIIITSTIEKVQIDQLFTSFKNFGQEFITEDNIKGRLSGTANFSTPIKSNFAIQSSKIISESNIRIEDGELINFQPLIELSKFLKLEKMDHVLFSTLENNIIIRDNAITIPDMEILSSALNLSGSGTHSFDKKYNYHLAVKLSELLFKKAQSSANKEFEIALDENDQRTIFLYLYDEGDGIIIEFDEQQAIKKIKADFKEEGGELKVVLNKEFGIFKDDDAVIESANKEETPMFKFEFPDEESTDTIKTEEKGKEKKRWWKKEEENKQEIDFVIDLDTIP